MRARGWNSSRTPQRRADACSAMAQSLPLTRTRDRPRKAGPQPESAISGPDGSVGNCVVCHTRNRFNIAEARKPAACASCHLGPYHPDIEIYNNSKHGHIFNAEGSSWNFTSAPDTWEPGDYRAPTCTVCHMSGIGELKTTHNISERLKWNLWLPESQIRNSPDPLSSLTGEGVEGRKKMESVCHNCHTTLPSVSLRFNCLSLPGRT
jgi:hydroxylamine dehydrogenase